MDEDVKEIDMEDYYEAYEENESSAEWWDGEEPENSEYYAEYEAGEDTDNAGEDASDEEVIEKLDSLIETLNLSQSYGSIGDYYNQTLGFTVFPDFDTYQYFIDIDADGSQWTEASDGHYVPLFALEVYEDYISPAEEEAEPQPTENEIQTLETLESANGTLSVIKANDTAYYETTLAYQSEILTELEEVNARLEVTGYLLMATAFFVALGVGNKFANSFFERMRAG